MVVLVAIQMVLPLLVSGPIASQFLGRDASFCSRFWYRNLLFINNFHDFDEQVRFWGWRESWCSLRALSNSSDSLYYWHLSEFIENANHYRSRPFGHQNSALNLTAQSLSKCVLISWTISTEIQLYSLLTLLVLLYSKRPLLARALNLVLLLSSMAYIVTIVYTNTLSPQLIEMPFDLNKLKARAKLIHFAPFAHVLEFFLPPFVFDLIFNKRIVRFHAVSSAFHSEKSHFNEL